jgi:hypothetical protein
VTAAHRRPISLKQTDYAARLYVLANTANMHVGRGYGDDERLVVECAIAKSRKALARMGTDYTALVSLAACIHEAMR